MRIAGLQLGHEKVGCAVGLRVRLRVGSPRLLGQSARSKLPMPVAALQLVNVIFRCPGGSREQLELGRFGYDLSSGFAPKQRLRSAYALAGGLETPANRFARLFIG